MTFDSGAHWRNLHRDPSLRAVGQSGLPLELNRWLYRAGRRNVIAFVRRAGLFVPPPSTVLDVGAGSGYWSRTWLELGAGSVAVNDLVEDAVERLQASFPGALTFLGDIRDAGVLPDDESYDFVSVMNVLLHITDEPGFDQAVHHIAGAVRPGGHVLLAEAALRRPWQGPQTPPDAASRPRTIERYRTAFAAAGLRLVAVGPSAVVAANPIDASTPGRLRWMSRAWGAIGRAAWVHPILAKALGIMLDTADRVLMRTGASPSGKLMVMEKPGPALTDSAKIDRAPDT